MISESAIRREASRRGIRRDRVEKDCVNSWILYGLYRWDQDTEFLFKGGTALSKLYHQSIRRFSEDLDFTLTERPSTDIVEKVMDRLDDIERESGISFELRESQREEDDPNVPGGNLGIRIKYSTPAFNHENTTEIDMDWGTTLQFNTETHMLKESFTDVPEFQLTAYAIEEIFVEKIRCLFMRPKTRDLYDVYTVLNDFSFDKSRIAQAVHAKLEEHNLTADLAQGIPTSTVEEVSGQWDQNLENLVYGEIPEFERVQADVEDYLLTLKESL